MRSSLVVLLMLALIAGIAGPASMPAQAAGWIIDPDGAP